MTFYVGQKVTLIHNWSPKRAAYADEVFPEYGAIYTIRSIDFDDNREWLRFIEIKNTPRLYIDIDGELRFSSKHFRPLVDTKQEVSFTIGADPDSEIWDNRKVKVK